MTIKARAPECCIGIATAGGFTFTVGGQQYNAGPAVMVHYRNTHHYEPRDERGVTDVLQIAGFNIVLRLQIKQQTLVDDVGQPADVMKSAESLIMYSLLIELFL